MEQNKTFIISFPITVMVSIIITLILILAWDKNIGFSFLLGSMTVMMTMSMLYKSSVKLLDLSKEVAQKAAMRNYAFRYLFYVIILVVAGLSENLNVLATAAGLFTFKFVLLTMSFLRRRGEEK